VVIVDKFSVADLGSGLPYQQGTYWVFPQDRVEEAADLILAPDERPLDVGQPEAAVLVRVIQKTDNLA